MKRIVPVLLLAYSVLGSGCFNNQNQPESQQSPVSDLKEHLLKVNKAHVYSEEDQISDFLSRYQYPVQSTTTGLRYYVYHHVNGLKPKGNSIVEVSYKVRLLDGTLCYSSDSTGTLEFQIGKTDLPVGLQEGIRLMAVGEKAIFITPSKLGYGFTGDGENIPPNAVLVYDVELLRIINQ
jgi:FKBP-type peptidyl-prolyl cis-trans isomerase